MFFFPQFYEHGPKQRFLADLEGALLRFGNDLEQSVFGIGHEPGVQTHTIQMKRGGGSDALNGSAILGCENRPQYFVSADDFIKALFQSTSIECAFKTEERDLAVHRLTGF